MPADYPNCSQLGLFQPLYGGKVSYAALRRTWREKFGDSCRDCTRQMDFKHHNSWSYATVDHILARALGGTEELENLRIICRRCNNDKAKVEQLHFKTTYGPMATKLQLWRAK